MPSEPPQSERVWRHAYWLCSEGRTLDALPGIARLIRRSPARRAGRPANLQSGPKAGGLPMLKRSQRFPVLIALDPIAVGAKELVIASPVSKLRILNVCPDATEVG